MRKKHSWIKKSLEKYQKNYALPKILYDKILNFEKYYKT